MTQVDFGRLDLSRIEHVIDDLDNCLAPYPDGYDEQFSVATAHEAIEMGREKFATGLDDEKLARLVEEDIEKLIDMSKDSYADTGFTTTYFEREFGINAIHLYDRHHRRIIRETVRPTFNRLASHGLRQAQVMTRNQGVKLHLFTNGTEYYARAKTEILGIDDCYDTIYGIDSYNDLAPQGDDKMLLLPKNIPMAWHDFFEETGIQPRKDGNGRWDYSNCVFFDDSIANLKIAKRFGIQTVLVKTDRVTPTKEDMVYIDAVADNITVFKCMMAQEMSDQKPYRVEQRPQQALKLVVSN